MSRLYTWLDTGEVVGCDMALDDDKKALVEQIDRVRERIRTLIDGVDPNVVIHPDSGWRLRDVLAHITAWQREAVEAGKAHISGGPPIPQQTIPRFNQEANEAARQMDVKDIYAAWAAVYDELKDVVTRAPAERWTAPFVFSWGAQGTLAQLVRSILSHDIEHLAEIRKAISQ